MQTKRTGQPARQVSPRPTPKATGPSDLARRVLGVLHGDKYMEHAYDHLPKPPDA